MALILNYYAAVLKLMVERQIEQIEMTRFLTMLETRYPQFSIDRRKARNEICSLVVNYDLRCQHSPLLQTEKASPTPSLDLLFMTHMRHNHINFRLYDPEKDGYWGLKYIDGKLQPYHLAGYIATQEIANAFSAVREKAKLYHPDQFVAVAAPDPLGPFSSLGAALLRHSKAEGELWSDGSCIFGKDLLSFIGRRQDGSHLFVSIIATAEVHTCVESLMRMSAFGSLTPDRLDRILILPAGVQDDLVQTIREMDPDVRLMTHASVINDLA